MALFLLFVFVLVDSVKFIVAFLVVFIAFICVYNVEGSWLFDIINRVGSFDLENPYTWARKEFATFTESPPSGNFWDNVGYFFTQLYNVVSFPVRFCVVCIVYVFNLLVRAFSFFPTN